MTSFSDDHRAFMRVAESRRVAEILIHFLRAVPVSRVHFFVERLAFDLELCDAAIQFVDLRREAVNLSLSFDAASSIRSMALSGRNRSVM